MSERHQVHGGSRYPGEEVGKLWRPLGNGDRAARRFAGAIINAAELFEGMTQRARGKHKSGGALGPSALKVLRALLKIVDYRTGRLEPSYEYIAQKAFCSRSAVHTAIKRLRHYGFLDWMRRAEAVDDPDGGGRRLRQLSNAYGFNLKRIAKALVTRLLGNAPLPDDYDWRRKQERAELRRMEDSLDLHELARLLVDGDLGAALAGLGALIGLRGSNCATESGPG